MPRGHAYARLMARLEAARAQGVTLGLERVRAALARLGDPQHQVPAVHLAGTNGKGSCAAMTESILRAAGFRTGLFTSPHLRRFTERIRIDGQEVDGDTLAALDEGLQGTGIPLSYFEIATVLAFRAFAELGVEIAVLETGLGGRLDATTACRPLACAITTIGLDHEALLGGSLAAIAHEKACIAKPGIPLFLGPLAAEAQASVEAVARVQAAPIRQLGVDVPPAPCAPALAGPHQERNAALAVALATEAAGRLGRPLADRFITQGLATVRWPGRLERVGRILFDCAHNPEGARALADALPDHPYRVLVTSIVRDKDAATMLATWAPHFDAIIVTTSPSERSRTPEGLAALVGNTRGGARVVECVPDPREALARAQQWAEARDGLVVVAGSIFLVGMLRDASPGLPTEPSDPLP